MAAVTVAAHREELALRDGRLFIDGAWVDASDGGTWLHTHPASGEDVGRFAVATAGDVARAVRAARSAFDEGPWPLLRAADRKRILQRIVDLIRAHADELVGVQALDNGLPVTFIRNVAYQLGAIPADFAWATPAWRQARSRSDRRSEPPWTPIVGSRPPAASALAVSVRDRSQAASQRVHSSSVGVATAEFQSQSGLASQSTSFHGLARDALWRTTENHESST